VTLNHRRVTDPRDMTALAHPLRLDLLEVLLVSGPMTASQAGRELDQFPSNVSWHLRKLAEHGFVRQSANASGRERPWRIVAESLSWGDDAEDSASSAALRDVAVERELQVLRRALAGYSGEPQEWKDATRVTSARLWLTADEAGDLGRRIADLVEATADRLGDPTLRPDGARLVALMSWLVPARPADPSGGPDGSADKSGRPASEPPGGPAC
jgi:DNA-binding transcriptional ArsR family regulator